MSALKCDTSMGISKTLLAETKPQMLKAALYATLISSAQAPVIHAGAEGRLLGKLCIGVSSLPSPSAQGALIITMKQKDWDAGSSWFSSLITEMGPSLSKYH